MSAPLTLQLNHNQVKAILKETFKTKPELVKEVLLEIQQEDNGNNAFDAVVDELFTEYGDVFKALA